ncbi:hypothetical protein HKD37_05G013238 [Glycine soja]
MTNKYNSVAEINSEKENISTNKQTSSIKIPFYMETMLVDSKGDTVHGSVKRTLIYKFDKNLQEGKVTTHHKYIIVFQYFTKVVLVDNASVPNFVYDCVPIRDIVCGVYDNKIHLQNCIYGARVVFNAECEKAKELATRMFESPSQGLSQIIDSTALSMLEDFLHNTARKTIGGLKDCFEDTCFAVFGIVKHVVDDEEWCYTACTCNKTVYPDSKMYRIKVHVIDESNSTNFVTFDRDATILFSKSCANMFETYHKDLMTKFSNVVENDSQCGEKEATDLSKDFEELTLTKYNYCFKSGMGELTPNESESPTQRKENYRLQEDWARAAEEGPRVLMNLRTHLLLEVASPLSLPSPFRCHSSSKEQRNPLMKKILGLQAPMEPTSSHSQKTWKVQISSWKVHNLKILKGKTDGVEQMQSQSLEMHFPLKSFKKGIKVEKI